MAGDSLFFDSSLSHAMAARNEEPVHLCRSHFLIRKGEWRQCSNDIYREDRVRVLRGFRVELQDDGPGVFQLRL